MRRSRRPSRPRRCPLLARISARFTKGPYALFFPALEILAERIFDSCVGPLIQCVDLLLVIYHGHMRSIRASDFRARCLAILDEVARTGEPITILKRGQPVACLLPLLQVGAKHPQLTLKGTFEIIGDIVEPAVPAEAWEAAGGGVP